MEAVQEDPRVQRPCWGGTDLHHHSIDSLLSLVLYYATNTMEKHNPELETQCLDTLHSMWTGAVIVELTLTH